MKKIFLSPLLDFFFKYTASITEEQRLELEYLKGNFLI